MTYKIKPCGGCYTVYDGNRWAATFANKSDAEAYVASRPLPLPEPTKHRCARKTTGEWFYFAVYETRSLGQSPIHVQGIGSFTEKLFRDTFDILPECE